MDVMTHSIEFGFEEFVYEGHCSYFLDETPPKFPRNMPPSLKDIFFQKFGTKAFGEAVILSIDGDKVRMKLLDRTQKVLVRSSLMNPIVVEIGKAWEAARNSPI